MDPESGLPMSCDMCESLDVKEPLCVQVSHPGALTYSERQVGEGDASPAARGEGEIAG